MPERKDRGDDGRGDAVTLVDVVTRAVASDNTPDLVITDAYAAQLIEGGEGGVGDLLKDRVGRVADFIQSVDAVAGGGVVIDPEMVLHLLGRARDTSPLARLTPREREVLAGMAEGKTNSEIAAALVVSEAAIAKHIGNIFAKLNLAPQVGDRRVLAVLAHLQG